MTFAHPALAFAAVTLPAAALVWEALAYAGARKAWTHPDVDFLARALRLPVWLSFALTATDTLALGAVVLGAAGPRYDSVQPAPETITICIDTSGSMSARDVQPTRAEAAASAVRAFAAGLPATMRLGVVAFSGAAQSRLAPTTDRGALLRALAELPAPNGQTAIGDALLRAAAMRLEGRRAVIVLTDGKNNRGVEPAIALQSLRAARVAALIVRIERGKDLVGTMRRFTDGLPRRREVCDLTVPVSFIGLTLLAAGWLARERGAFRP